MKISLALGYRPWAEFGCGACPQVMRVLKVAGILGLMHQYESKEEAIYSREV